MVIDVVSSRKGPSGIAHEHQMNNLDDTVIRELAATMKAAKYHWHAYPLDWSEMRIHELFVLQTLHKLDRRTFSHKGVSM